METKKEIRQSTLSLRRSLSDTYINEKSELIKLKLTNEPEYINCNDLYIYMNMRDEVSTEGIITDALASGKNVWIPRTYDKYIAFYKLDNINNTTLGYFNILEPLSEIEADYSKGLVIVPMVAFDDSLNRIGYGRGYYDRFLSKHKQLSDIGIAFEMQRTDRIPVGSTDRKLNTIITEASNYI